MAPVAASNTVSSGRKFSKFKSEESGYDSDTTRNGSSSSPRGSVKSDSYDPCDSYDSSTSDKGETPGDLVSKMIFLLQINHLASPSQN